MNLSPAWSELNEAQLRADLAAHPDSAASNNLLGLYLRQRNRFDEAESLIRRANALQPDTPEIMFNLALVLTDLQRDPEAEALLRRVLPMRPDWAVANRMLGWLTGSDGRMEEAEQFFLAAFTTEPDNPENMLALGEIYQVTHRPVEAEALFRRALAINPESIAYAERLSGLLIFARKCEEAEALMRRILEVDPERRNIRISLGEMLLLLGRWQEGWSLYEWRLTPPVKELRSFNVSRAMESLPVRTWQGQSLDGKSLLISTEQGLGDNIQFIRYVAELKSRYTVQITVRCFDPLFSLFQNVAGIDKLIKVSDSAQVYAHPYEYDFHCFIVSLPHHLSDSHPTPVARVPYIGLPANKIRHWARIVEERSSARKIKVGLVWGSNPTMGGWKAGVVKFGPGPLRSVALTTLLPVLEMPQFDFFSLQMGEARDELATIPTDLRPIDLMDGVKDLVDTGAIVESLDLVISVDTSVAHLTGALNKPLWLLTMVNADWRWMLNGEDSPWYPSARIFRQTRFKEWDDMIQRVVQALLALVDDQAKLPSHA